MHKGPGGWPPWRVQKVAPHCFYTSVRRAPLTAKGETQSGGTQLQCACVCQCTCPCTGMHACLYTCLYTCRYAEACAVVSRRIRSPLLGNHGKQRRRRALNKQSWGSGTKPATMASGDVGERNEPLLDPRDPSRRGRLLLWLDLFVLAGGCIVTYTAIQVWRHVYTHVYMSTHMCTYMCTHMCTHMPTLMYVHRARSPSRQSSSGVQVRHSCRHT